MHQSKAYPSQNGITELRNKGNIRYNEMKKIMIIALMGLMAIGEARSQEIYNQVVANAKQVIDDPKSDSFIIAVAQFKYTAMQYLCSTAIKQNGQVEGDLLDRQAVALNNFIISYFGELVKAQKSSDSTQKDIMKRYWRACNNNPMFANQDREITDAFINDPDCITPFSINTNWELANQTISEKKK